MQNSVKKYFKVLALVLAVVIPGFIMIVQGADPLTPILRTLQLVPSKASTGSYALSVTAKDGSNTFIVLPTNAVPQVTQGGSNFAGISTNIVMTNSAVTRQLQIVKGIIVGVQ